MKNELFIMEMVSNPFAVKLYLHYLVNQTLYIFMQVSKELHCVLGLSNDFM